MTIHGDHPFLVPENERDPVRRFRGRVATGVSVWTSTYDGHPAGLTVSSMLVADGSPGRLLGLLDPDSDLWETLSQSRAAAVSLLGYQHREISDVFAGLAPSPGGLFRSGSWKDSEWGPVLDSPYPWAGCRLAPTEPRQVGYSLLVEVLLEHIDLGTADSDFLVHHRSRYHRLT